MASAQEAPRIACPEEARTTFTTSRSAAQRASDRLETISAGLGFTERTGEKLYSYTFPPREGVAATNLVIEPRTVTIANARPIADRFSLDVEGFAVVRHRSAVRDFWDEARTLALGHPEAADLLPSELIFPHRRGETYALAYNPARRWCYVPDLDIDETLLIKCWDADEAVARFAPHTGFDDPITPPGTPPRESIEFRAIAFFD